jgi:hypothetical protein
MQSAADAGRFSNDLGVAPTKLLVAFAVALVACVGGFSLLGETVAERILWAGGGLIAGLGLFSFVLVIFVTRTPWKFENEMVLAQDARFDDLHASIEQLGAVYAAYRTAAETRIADLVRENARVASLNPQVAILKHEVGKFIERYKSALALLGELKGHAISLLFQLDNECKEYLGRHLAAYRGFFAKHALVREYWQQEDENDAPLAAGPAEKYATICNDRLEKLGESLGLVR